MPPVDAVCNPGHVEHPDLSGIYRTAPHPDKLGFLMKSAQAGSKPRSESVHLFLEFTINELMNFWFFAEMDATSEGTQFKQGAPAVNRTL